MAAHYTNAPPDLAEKIWATLVNLFAEQNGVKVEYVIDRTDEIHPLREGGEAHGNECANHAAHLRDHPDAGLPPEE